MRFLVRGFIPKMRLRSSGRFHMTLGGLMRSIYTPGIPDLHENIGKKSCEAVKEEKLMDVVDQFLNHGIAQSIVIAMACLLLGFMIILLNTTLLLWNPSTGESIVLSTPKYPVEEFSCLGMCYDLTSGDNKILKIDENVHDGRRVPSEILTLKSGFWRNIDEHPRLICNVVSGMHSLAFVHGTFHWVGISKNYLVVSFNILINYSVVSFNISHEVYKEIPLPKKICLVRDTINIGISVLDEMICAYSNMYHQGNHTFRLCLMKDYGVKESWNEVFAIEDRDILPHKNINLQMVKCYSGACMGRNHF
ncbi:hypothetical protein RND71_025139 [Anisodus tanguticus]|uniref:F-box associated beta-propeller type 1 domain-containing protein n=1 Tax=Anisodus tanguticus TaxID=243964 RepID=A0AAE1V4K2_9SOLA|nr:hypothetical protein RND71_025139 [Anisodus tanguticus]